MADKFTKLSDAMEAGASSVTEDIFVFLHDLSESQCKGCALGTAWYAVRGQRRLDFGSSVEMFELLGRRFGISQDRLLDISVEHRLQLKTRAEIIAELRAEGL